MSRKYARGRHAVAECQRSGQKMMYRDLVEDGHVPGLLVHPDWWEPKHPQETPPDTTDPVALHRPAPEISIEPDYAEPEQPLPLPTTPSGPATGVLAVTAITGAPQLVLDNAARYTIGDIVLVALDGGGFFVSRITTTAESPSLTIPLTTAFAGTATAGNDFHIEAG